jgi:hypothetical protein
MPACVPFPCPLADATPRQTSQRADADDVGHHGIGAEENRSFRPRAARTGKCRPTLSAPPVNRRVAGSKPARGANSAVRYDASHHVHDAAEPFVPGHGQRRRCNCRTTPLRNCGDGAGRQQGREPYLELLNPPDEAREVWTVPREPAALASASAWRSPR